MRGQDVLEAGGARERVEHAPPRGLEHVVRDVLLHARHEREHLPARKQRVPGRVRPGAARRQRSRQTPCGVRKHQLQPKEQRVLCERVGREHEALRQGHAQTRRKDVHDAHGRSRSALGPPGNAEELLGERELRQLELQTRVLPGRTHSRVPERAQPLGANRPRRALELRARRGHELRIRI